MKILKILSVILILFLFTISCQKHVPEETPSDSDDKRMTVGEFFDSIDFDNERIFGERVSVESFLDKSYENDRIDADVFFDAFENSLLPEKKEKIKIFYSENFDSIGTLYKKAVTGHE